MFTHIHRYVRRLKHNVCGFVQVTKIISGTRWGCSVSDRLRLYNALFVGLLRYSLPALNGMSRTNVKDLESLHAQELRICFGLPKCTSTSRTFVESHVRSPGVLRLQNALRVNLRHERHNTNGHLKGTAVARNSAACYQPLALFHGELTTPYRPPRLLSAPPSHYPPIHVDSLFPVWLRNCVNRESACPGTHAFHERIPCLRLHKWFLLTCFILFYSIYSLP